MPCVNLDRNQRSILTVPAEDARLLRLLTESISSMWSSSERPTIIPASWFALALQGTGGKLTNFETDPRVSSKRDVVFIGNSGTIRLNVL